MDVSKQASTPDNKEQESLQHSSKFDHEGGGHLTGRLAGDVTALASDGRGVVKTKEQVFFARSVVPGDRVAFKPDLSSKPASALDVKVLRRSEYRAVHPCRHAKECQASVWGIVSYERQLIEKQDLVRRVMRGAVDPAVIREIVPSPLQWAYRNRVGLQVSAKPRGGFDLGYASGARDSAIVGISSCLLASDTISEAIKRVAECLASDRALSRDALPHRLSLFETAAGAGGLAVYKGRPKETDVQLFLEFALSFELAGGIWAANGSQAGLVGERGMFWRTKESRSMLVEWLGHKFDVHPASFAQVNNGSAQFILQHLFGHRHEFHSSQVWDLYGGYGALGFALALEGAKLCVVEQNSWSESTFKKLQELNPLVEAKFIKGDVARLLSKSQVKLGKDDLVILDPPRSGCHPEVLEAIVKARTDRILYLSCNPARFARDLKILAASAYQAKEILPVDFFPQTPEIEVLALIEKC